MENVDQIHNVLSAQVQKRADFQDAERKAIHSQSRGVTCAIRVTDQKGNVLGQSEALPLLPLLLYLTETLATVGANGMRPCGDNSLVDKGNLYVASQSPACLHAEAGGPSGDLVTLVEVADEELHYLQNYRT
ncbi:unnamed protein product, partial [Prorocentrum cordatum]